MKLPRKTTYALLVAIVLANLAVRYPRTPHGVGVDSFAFAALSNAILQHGYAAWIVHPLSPFGLYPLSYPSGSFLLTAAFAGMAGVSIEVTTLFLSLFVGVFGVFSAFIMARGFWKNDLFSLSVALLFSLMPKFVTTTLWEVPARGLFMALTPLFLWAVLRTLRNPTVGNAAIGVMIFLLMSLFHRLAVLMLVVFMAFMVMLIFAVVAGIARRRFPRALMSPAFHRRSRVAGLVLYGSVVIGLLLGSGVLESYETGALFSSPAPYASLGNLAVSLTRSVGALSPLALVGVSAVLFMRAKGLPEYLYLSTPLAIIPTLFLRSYTGFYIVTFFALFIAMGFTAIVLKFKGRIRGLAVAALLAVAAVIAAQAVTYELPRQSYMSDAEYSTSLYARYHVSGTFASNDGLLGARLASVSGGSYLPIGGATTAQYGPEALAFGFVGGFSTVSVPIQELNVDSDALFYPIGVTVGSEWSVMMAGPMDRQGERIANRYDVTTILEDPRGHALYYTGWGVTYDSRLLQDIYNTRYLTYDTGGARLWAAF